MSTSGPNPSHTGPFPTPLCTQQPKFSQIRTIPPAMGTDMRGEERGSSVPEVLWVLVARVPLVGILDGGVYYDHR